MAGFVDDVTRTCLVVALTFTVMKGALCQDLISGETCFDETFEASCNGSDVILMEKASYGRPQTGRCISGEVGHLGCAKDIIEFMDRRCSGRSSCSVSILLTLSKEFKPCSKELFTFLLTSYSCQPVTSGDEEQCRLYNETHIEGTTGVFHSSTPHKGILGTNSCPWVLTAQPGQRVLFMLYDFTLRDTTSGDMQQTCAASLVINEGSHSGVELEGEEKSGFDPRAGLKLCGDSSRVRHLYTTLSHTAKVHIEYIPDLKALPNFLISYEAVGCPYFETPSNMWVTIDDDIATVVCNFTGETWYLICRDTVWVGELGNCSQVVATPGPPGPETGFPLGILIAVVIGVVLGAVVGISLLGLVFLCRRCICPPKKRPQMPVHQPSMTSRDVPPMNELIRSATVMAKQSDTRHKAYGTYQRSPHPYTTHKFPHQVEYHPQGSIASREEHVYESYIYKDGTIRSRKDSASESGGSGYCEMEGSVISDFPVGRPIRIPVDHVIAQVPTGAHPVDTGDIEKM